MNNHWKKDVTLFIVSQVISLFGSSLVMYAIMWYITLETKSGAMMAISVVVGTLPTFLLSPFAGVWADRYDRKKLIMLSDSFIAITTLVVALLFMAGLNSIVLLFVASALRAMGGAVQTPAVNAMIPQIVPEDRLLRVQGINGSIQSTIMLVSPMLSGALLSFSTITVIFFVDVITAALAVFVLLLFLKVPTHKKALSKQTTGYVKDLKEGMSYVLDHSYIRKFFLFIGIFMFLIVPVAMLTPLQVARSFGDDVWRLSVVEIAFSLGTMLGGILIATWGGFKNKVYTMTMACLVISILSIALGIVQIFWLYILIMGLIGTQVPLYNTPSMVMLQETVEENFMGRVFGIMGMIGSLVMPLGMVLFGPLSDVIAIEYILIGSGVLLIIVSLSLIGTKEIVKAGWETAN